MDWWRKSHQASCGQWKRSFPTLKNTWKESRKRFWLAKQSLEMWGNNKESEKFQWLSSRTQEKTERKLIFKRDIGVQKGNEYECQTLKLTGWTWKI